MSKTLGYCQHCERPQVVDPNHRSPSGHKNCGICGKNSLLFAFLLLMGISFAALTDTDCTWVGWDSIQICGQFAQNVSFVTYVTNVTVTNVTSITNITNITNVSNMIAGSTNSVEILWIWALLIILLYISAAFSHIKMMGVFASLLLLLLGVWVFTNGITYRVGEFVGGSDRITGILDGTNTSGNVSLTQNMTLYKNETKAYGYATATVPTFGPLVFNELLGFSLILIAIYGMYYFGLQAYNLGRKSD